MQDKTSAITGGAITGALAFADGLPAMTARKYAAVGSASADGEDATAKEAE